MTPSSSLSPGSLLNQLRQTTPLVHNITNHVAMTPTANTLLAIGASPLMAHAQQEIQEISAISAALSINIGTLSPSWIEAMQLAAMCAHRDGKPWVLDPVAHFATGFRQKAALDLLDLGPTILRGNASEILAFSGATSAGKGVDAGDSVAAAEETAKTLANERNMVVAVTGERDFVTDGTRSARITEYGQPLGNVDAFCRTQRSTLDKPSHSLPRKQRRIDRPDFVGSRGDPVRGWRLPPVGRAEQLNQLWVDTDDLE